MQTIVDTHQGYHNCGAWPLLAQALWEDEHAPSYLRRNSSSEASALRKLKKDLQ